MDVPPPPRPRPPWVPLAALYVAGGLPGSVLRDALPGVLRAEGRDLTEITPLVADLGLAWTLKFLWAPLVDARGSRRAWVVGAQALMLAAFVGLAITLRGGALGAAEIGLLAAVAVGSATLDIASDAWTLEAFDPGAARARANGLRLAAYRVGMVVGGGFLVARAADWGPATLWAGPAVLIAASLVASLRLPEGARARPPSVAPAVVLSRFLDRPRIVVALLFATLYKVGDQAMAGLVRPFLVDQGFTPSQLGDVYAPLTIVAGILGAGVGGQATARLGVGRALLVLGGAQAVSNLGFAAAAATGSSAVTWVAAAVEPFCSGLGAAAFVTFLMGACDPRHAAAHYAGFTALMGLGGWGAARWSGAAANATGYAGWFALTFVLALPALALVPTLQRAGWCTPRRLGPGGTAAPPA